MSLGVIVQLAFSCLMASTMLGAITGTQPLDATWTAACGNQTVQVAEDGGFRIGSIHFWDTSPADGLSDLYFEVILVNSDGSEYARTVDLFRLQAGQTVFAGEVVFTDEPPVLPSESRDCVP